MLGAGGDKPIGYRTPFSALLAEVIVPWSHLRSRSAPGKTPVSVSLLHGGRMIRLTVLYPTTEGATFDHDYYREKHVPLCVQTWGLDGAEIDKGIDGPYVAAVHFKFTSPEALQAAMASEGTGTIMADVANYTTITPVLQTSEIV